VALTRFNVRLDSDQVAALEVLSRRLSFERNFQISWGSLLRTGAAWVLALEGRPPAEIENAKKNIER
jgi:hypothetical protein